MGQRDLFDAELQYNIRMITSSPDASRLRITFAWGLAACSGGVALVATPITGTFVDSPASGLHD